MDRFIKIDPITRLKKTIVAERDGALIELYPSFMPSHEANELYKELKNLTDWKIRETMTRDGMKPTARLTMGLVNPELRGKLMEHPSYTPVARTNSTGNSSQEYQIEDSDDVFPPLLLAAHEKIKELTGETFNYAYLNYYRDGNDHISFHADKEETLEDGSTIASLSLGATRDFVIRHIGDTRLAQNMSDDQLRLEALEAAKQTISLKAGSLLLMKKQTQKVYHHQVPKRLNVKSPRINITFRHIRDLDS